MRHFPVHKIESIRIVLWCNGSTAVFGSACPGSNPGKTTNSPRPFFRCKMTADIAISTHKQAGIQRLAQGNLPNIPDVRYIISWQSHENAPIPEQLSDRDDVTIIRFDGHGQSHNRNNALEHCNADIVIISDDDLIYRPDGIKAALAEFEKNPQMEVATFRSIHDPSISYPDKITPLSLPLPRNYYVSCFEIALRRNSEAGKLRFNPELGLNSPRMHGGEDEVFILTAIRRGLDCRFLPITVCEHPDLSTGLKSRLSAANLRAMGCVITLYYPATAPLRLILKAWRLSRAGRTSLPRALHHLFSGALATPALRKRTATYL